MDSRYGFIGAGHLGQSIIRALVQRSGVPPEAICATNRTEKKLLRFAGETKIQTRRTNEELVDACEIIFLAVKPQDLVAAIEPISSSFGPHHLVVSFAAGVSLADLQKTLPSVKNLFRVMPNTPTRIGQGVIGYLGSPTATAVGEKKLCDLLSPLGLLLKTENEEQLQAVTVACSSGVGFVLELMIYWQEWLEEYNFSKGMARDLARQTFLGAAQLSATGHPETHLADLQKQVVSAKGVTAAGLDSMRELEIERLLRISFEKALMRDQDIGRF